MLTNATVVDDAIRFVSDRLKDKLKSSSNSNDDNKESKEPDYEYRDQSEEEQEGETGEVTTNQVF
jgi:hypothetical protein